MKSLIQFKRLEDFLEKNKYIYQKREPYKLIVKDFTIEEKKGNIEYTSEGIFLLQNGNKYQGYLSLKVADLESHGFPKFHVVECRTILEQKRIGNFDDRYFFNNSKFVTITDSKSGEIFENQKLDLCKNCIKVLKECNYENTIEFSELLEQFNLKIANGEVKLRNDGRPFEWEKISKAYKLRKNYTCEICGFGGDSLKTFDRFYIETDHVIAWELTNLNEDNLQCMCVLCHSQKDEIHQENYRKPAQLKKIKRFVGKFKEQLVALNNPYIQSIDEFLK